MAKVKDPLRSLQASGSISGITYQDWRGLGVVREKPVPTQPNSVRQIATRTVMSVLSKIWANTLNEGQRTAWNAFADVFVWTDIFGRELRLTGINLFAKINFQLQDFGKSLQLTPPPAVNPPEVVIESISNSAGFVTATITPVTEGELAAQSPFLDLWLAGFWQIGSVIQQAEEISIELKGSAMPQGVNPVKSDYRHNVYIPSTALAPPPGIKTMIITFRPLVGDFWTEPRRISALIKRYNKNGRYSVVQKISLVSTVAP